MHPPPQKKVSFNILFVSMLQLTALHKYLNFKYWHSFTETLKLIQSTMSIISPSSTSAIQSKWLRMFYKRTGMSRMYCDCTKIYCIWPDSQHGPVSACFRFSHFANNAQYSKLGNRPSLRDERASRTTIWRRYCRQFGRESNSAGFQTDIKRTHVQKTKKQCPAGQWVQDFSTGERQIAKETGGRQRHVKNCYKTQSQKIMQVDAIVTRNEARYEDFLPQVIMVLWSVYLQ